MTAISLKENDIQLIIVRSFFEQLNDPFVSDLFLKLLQLKKNGYQTKHSSRFLPVAANDFFCMHLRLESLDSTTAPLYPVSDVTVTRLICISLIHMSH